MGRESRQREVGEEIDESGLIFFQARRELRVYSGGIATMVCQRSRLRKKGMRTWSSRRKGRDEESCRTGRPQVLVRTENQRPA